MKIALRSVYRANNTNAPSRIDFLRECAAQDCWKNHSLVEDESAADAILITEAWRHQDLPFFLKVLFSRYGSNYSNKTFVYCDSDSGGYLGQGFYPSVTKNVILDGRQFSCPYITPVMKRFESKVIRNQIHGPPYLFSFVGSASSHKCRRKILNIEHARSLLIDTSNSWKFTESQPADSERLQKDYVNSLLSSKFVLCPRGKGSSSFRVFETMACGRVPVVISDSWCEPHGLAWNTFAIRIAEDNITNISSILEMKESHWEHMAALSLMNYKKFFSTASLFNYLGDQMEEALKVMNSSARIGGGQIRKRVRSCFILSMDELIYQSRGLRRLTRRLGSK